MSSAILELNDLGLRLFADGAIVADSPGFATITRKQEFFGAESEARVKMLPTFTSYHFWDGLSQDLLEHPNRLATTRADLAYLHLQSLLADQPALVNLTLLVPGDVGKDQLALLLGIISHLGKTVPAVVDGAIAACQRPCPGQRLMHLDLHLHRAVLSELDQGQELSLEQAFTTTEVGMLRIREAWSDAITRLFVQATRFDPQHEAAVEQQLYDKLGSWINDMQQDGIIEAELNQDELRFATRLNLDVLLSASKPLYRRLLDFISDHLPAEQPITLAVSHRIAALPGLLAQLEALPNVSLQLLTEDAALTGAAELLNRELPQSDGVPLVRSKAWFDQSNIEQHSEALADYQRQAPSHVLYQDRAYPVTNGGVWVGSDAGATITIDPGIKNIQQRHLQLRRDEQRVVLINAPDAQTRLNRHPVEKPMELGIGDRIAIGDPESELLLITIVEDPGEPA